MSAQIIPFPIERTRARIQERAAIAFDDALQERAAIAFADALKAALADHPPVKPPYDVWFEPEDT